MREGSNGRVRTPRRVGHDDRYIIRITRRVRRRPRLSRTCPWRNRADWARPGRARRCTATGPNRPRSESNGPESNGSGDPTAAKKRRRRGSRGGRGRKKPAGATGAGADNTARTDDDIDDDVAAGPISAGEDWTDEAADRGLTSEDLGDDAREEAGLPARRNGAPKVGDSRPAATSPRGGEAPDRRQPARARERRGRGRSGRPREESAGEDGPKKRRRRRGGRGRSKGGGEAGAGTAAVANPAAAATASPGVAAATDRSSRRPRTWTRASP